MVSVQKMFRQLLDEYLESAAIELGESIRYSDNITGENNYSYFDKFDSFYDWAWVNMADPDRILDYTFGEDLDDNILQYIVDEVFDKLNDKDRLKLVSAYTKTGEIPDTEEIHGWFDWKDYEQIKNDVDKAAYSIVMDIYDTEMDNIMSSLYKKYIPIMKRAYKNA